MARVETPASLIGRDELKKEIRQEVRREDMRKKTAGMVGCLAVMAIVIGIPVLWTLSLVAKTGFVEVPVLTQWLYRPAEPARKVLPLGTATTESVMRLIAQHTFYNEHTGLVTVTAKEAELTTLVQYGVWEAAPESLPFKIKTAQVVVGDGVVEVFLVSPRPHRDATVLVRFAPSVDVSGKPRIEVRELRFGALEVPPWIARILTAPAAAAIGGTIQGEASKGGTLVNIVAGRGELGFVIAPKNN